MTRHDIVFAHAWYALHWGPTRYDARLHRLGVRLGRGQTFESEDSEVKRAYGALVRRHHAYYVGYERLARRARGRGGIGPWPGSAHMRLGEYAWLRSQGLLDAVHAMVGE